ncbi:phosphotransferase [Deinococcus depolymerans]|uniref:Aminoglycoside phosphotransferase family protein n=1 Tax=Deinococcus depolymerans TaxID=392408 RepID=A0ABN1CK30_9DEIO
MTLRSAPHGDAPSPRFPVLEARFGPLRPLDAGMQSRVYATADGVIVKVYRNQQGDHRTEADNLRRAGLGDWVIDALEADGIEALVMRQFPGRPLRPADVTRAAGPLRAVLGALHREQRGVVDLRRVRERLQRFRSALAAYPLEDLFDAVELPLERGLLDRPASFCHLDLWHDNILITDQAGPDQRLLVIDWTKSGWDDPLRDLALLKTGTLDLLAPDESLRLALEFLPDHAPITLTRYRAYLALTTLHDLYWLLMNEPYEFDGQRAEKLPRARHVLARLPALP